MAGATAQIIEHNAGYAERFDKGSQHVPPAREVAILTCMDARIMPQEVFGIDFGDAHVIRNAGGRATDDAIRSFIISHELLGTKEFLVVHHTDCGMLSFTDEQLQQRLGEKYGTDAGDVHFHTFTDLEQSVRDDVAAVRAVRFLPEDLPVRGFVFDVKTGRLSEVS